MKFVFPTAEYEQRAKDFLQEFHDHGSDIHGAGGLARFLENDDYAGWLANCMQYIDLANVPEEWVPAITYFYVNENSGEIVGMINIRLALNDFLRKQGGHIGYSIRPTRRKQGHATNMLRETLRFCARIGLRDVIITCNKDNLGSAKVIENCGGVLQEELYSQAFGCIMQKYIIISDSHILGNIML